jgi:hypothetical protein
VAFTICRIDVESSTVIIVLFIGIALFAPLLALGAVWGVLFHAAVFAVKIDLR